MGTTVAMIDYVTEYAEQIVDGKIVCGELVRLACERHLDDLENAPERGYFFDPEEAQYVFDFFKCLRLWEGKWAGQKFELELWQKFKIGSIFGWRSLETGLRRFRTVYLEVARKNAKALSLDTPIPTPNGFVEMRDIKIGDRLFDENGKTCNVIETSPVYINNKCYEVEFSTGEKIVADAGHLWGTVSARKKGGGKGIRTTEEIKKTLSRSQGKNHKLEWNHKVAVAGAFTKSRPSEFEIPPYVLGRWLGDGESASSRITVNQIDFQIRERITACGLSCVENKTKGDAGLYRIEGTKRPLITLLRKKGLYKNKHIPEEYLWGDCSQRMELLRGLMDAGGSASKAGNCSFSNTNKKLIDGVYRLLCSLGFKPEIQEGLAKRYGKECGKCWKATFNAYSNTRIFHLDRKQKRLRKRPIKPARSQFRQIVSVREVKSVPVKCIQVDSPNKMFLCGEGFIPTHNSTVLAGVGLYMLDADGEAGAQVYAAATKKDQAKIIFNCAKRLAESSPGLSQKINVYLNNLSVLQSYSKFEPLASDSKKADGFSVSCGLVDELHEHPNGGMMDVLETGTGGREQPLIIYITTAGQDKTSVCYEQHEYSKNILKGRIKDDTYFSLIYQLDEGDDWRDEKVWLKANPNLNVSQSADDLIRKRDKARHVLRQQTTFRRKHCNEWVGSDEKWLDVEAWDACVGPFNPELLKGKKCYAALDLSSKLDLTALVLLFPPKEETGIYKILPYFWIPGENIEQKSKKDRCPYDVWLDQGFIEATKGNVVDYRHIQNKIAKLAKRYKIVEIGYDPWNATETALKLQDDGFEMVEVRQGSKTLSEPMKQIEALVVNKQLAHNGNPVLSWMADNLIVRTDPNDNIAPSKKMSRQKIDGMCAFISAMARVMGQEDFESVYKQRGLVVLKPRKK